MANDRKPFLIAGLGLAGFAGWQLLHKPGTAPTPTPTPTPSGDRIAFNPWVGACRSDIVAGLQQGRYRDVIGQYAREAYPEFWARSDILAAVSRGDWTGIVGEFLREIAPGFVGRGDIAPAVARNRWGDVFGQFCKESPASGCVNGSFPNPTQGNPAASQAPGQGPGGSPGTGVTPPGLPPTGTGRPPLSTKGQLGAGMLISTGCGWNQADYVVVPDRWTGSGLARLWIRDKFTWDALGAPRSALRIVTRPLLLSVRDAGTIWYGQVLRTGLRWQFSPSGSSGVFGGAPSLPPSVLKTPAGWC